MLLGRYPGRKDLIWFSGGSNLALMVDAGDLPLNVNMQPIYDELERLAHRGVSGGCRGLMVTEFGGGAAGSTSMMQDTAEATGGRAFYNNNGLEEIAREIVNSSSDFYTLTYSPQRSHSSTTNGTR